MFLEIQWGFQKYPRLLKLILFWFTSVKKKSDTNFLGHPVDSHINSGNRPAGLGKVKGYKWPQQIILDDDQWSDDLAKMEKS